MSLLLLFNQPQVVGAQEVFEDFMTMLRLNDTRITASSSDPVALLTHIKNPDHYESSEELSMLSNNQEKTALAHNQSDAELLEEENISIMQTESKETYVS